MSRSSSWLPAPASQHKAPMPTPAREARGDLPQVHAVWRRPSGVSSSSQAGALSPRDHLFSEFPWRAWERASRCRSWLPAPESLHKAPRATPAREARGDLPRAHAVWRKPSGVSGSSAAGVLSSRANLFSVRPWRAWERASNRRRGSQPPRARGMAAHAEAAPRAGALLRQLAAESPGSGMPRGGW